MHDSVGDRISLDIVFLRAFEVVEYSVHDKPELASCCVFAGSLHPCECHRGVIWWNHVVKSCDICVFSRLTCTGCTVQVDQVGGLCMQYLHSDCSFL